MMKKLEMSSSEYHDKVIKTNHLIVRYIKNMDGYFLVGIAAALLTTFGFVPQTVKMYRVKSVKDVSLATLFQFGVGVALWALYGFYRNDAIIVTANTISFVILVAAITLYYHYRHECLA